MAQKEKDRRFCADLFLCDGTFCGYRAHSAAGRERDMTAWDGGMIVRQYPKSVARPEPHISVQIPFTSPYEEHKMDILRKNGFLPGYLLLFMKSIPKKVFYDAGRSYLPTKRCTPAQPEGQNIGFLRLGKF